MKPNKNKITYYIITCSKVQLFYSKTHSNHVTPRQYDHVINKNNINKYAKIEKY